MCDRTTVLLSVFVKAGTWLCYHLHDHTIAFTGPSQGFFDNAVINVNTKTTDKRCSFGEIETIFAMLFLKTSYIPGPGFNAAQASDN